MCVYACVSVPPWNRVTSVSSISLFLRASLASSAIFRCLRMQTFERKEEVEEEEEEEKQQQQQQQEDEEKEGDGEVAVGG